MYTAVTMRRYASCFFNSSLNIDFVKVLDNTLCIVSGIVGTEEGLTPGFYPYTYF